MTREEYAKRMKKQPDWAPGWDAIDAAFAKLYPKAEPVRFESELHDRAALGGEEYLDGFAVYDTGKGYHCHLRLERVVPKHGGLWLGIQQVGL